MAASTHSMQRHCPLLGVPTAPSLDCSAADCMQVLERGCALLGYVPIAGTAMVVLATRVRPAATLPGGHIVRLVVEHKWLQLPLQASPPAALPHRYKSIVASKLHVLRLTVRRQCSAPARRPASLCVFLDIFMSAVTWGHHCLMELAHWARQLALLRCNSARHP